MLTRPQLCVYTRTHARDNKITYLSSLILLFLIRSLQNNFMASGRPSSVLEILIEGRIKYGVTCSMK